MICQKTVFSLIKWIPTFLLLSVQACSQPTSRINPEKFSSKYVRLIQDTSKMMLIQNVIVHYDDLYVEADSALLDKPNSSVTAFGIKKARFKGRELTKNEYGDLIRYKKGDRNFFTE